MLRKIYFLILSILLAVPAFSQSGAGSIKGKLLDQATGEGIPFATVVAKKNGAVVTGANTDYEGNFFIKPLEPGKYDVEASYVGYSKKMVSGVIVTGNNITFLDIKLDAGVEMKTVEIVKYTVPLINKDGGASGGTITRDEIARMPGRSATSIATTIAGVSDAGTGGGVSIRGARTDGDFYYIDGIKVRGSANLPKSAIQEVNVITGGIPANYGDATGGIISITTRGPSAIYFGGVEVVSSGFKSGKKAVGLDPYGYNLVEGFLSGPILFKKDADGKKDRPILGFFASLNYNSLVDQNPSVIGYYELDPAKKADLINTPLFTTGEQNAGSGQQTAFYRSDFLLGSDFNNISTGLNAGRNIISGQGKLDFTLTETSNLSFGGSFNYQKQRNFTFLNTLFNTENNALRKDFDWRAFGRFTQRFRDDAESKSTIKNAYYNINIDYTKSQTETMNADHGKDFFSYGYVGKFVPVPKQEIFYDSVRSEFGDFLYFDQSALPGDSFLVYTPGDKNPVLAAYTSTYFSLFDSIRGNTERLDQIVNRGLRNGDAPSRVYGLWNNIGAPAGAYSKFDNTQFRVTAAGSADIGNHAISLGFEYEQRSDRGYSLGNLVGDETARGTNIWSLARRLTNFHTNQLNRLDSTISIEEGNIYVHRQRSPYGGVDQSFFDRNLRKALGLDVEGIDYINIDALDPEQLSVDFFSAGELLQGGTSSLVNYYGYDHRGNKLKGKPTVEDFFNQVDESETRFFREVEFVEDSAGNETDIPMRDANGNVITTTRSVAPRTYAIGAFQPIYFAGYIMDKFAFDDIIFNVGLRVDRYDANQKVLKDKYLWREAYTAGSDKAKNLAADNDQTIPGNIGSDYTVYVDNALNPTTILGYRKGDTFYNASGKEANPKAVLNSSGSIAPYLVSQSTIESELEPRAFKDYVPQVNLMPRIAFSFPISDEAVFFAHYDILTRRPASNNRLDLFGYYYINSRNSSAGNPINNPDLKPEKTIDYELGFQQVVSKSSSLKIAIFYREQRQMIQVYQNVGAYPQDYYTLENLDFGTIKGLTIGYDLRRTNNIWMKINYTLQFADGTGSAVGGEVNLNNTNFSTLRSIAPYDYDQRHKINATVDYRYGSGSAYNGPVLFGTNILANTGVNFVVDLGSGTPYSASTMTSSITNRQNRLEGSINGSRMPWRFRTDLQIDKDIPLVFKKGEGDNAKRGNLNVYLLFNNLFNSKIINNVYRATGNPDDDGYLADARWQAEINEKANEQSFRDMYALRLLNGGFYGAPRTIRLGLKLDF